MSITPEQILTTLDQILEDHDGQFPWPADPTIGDRQNYLAGIYSLLDCEFLAFPPTLLQISYRACLLYGLCSFVAFTDNGPRHGMGVFDIKVAAKFLNIPFEWVVPGMKEVSDYSKEQPGGHIHFEEIDGLVYFWQKI